MAVLSFYVLTIIFSLLSEVKSLEKKFSSLQKRHLSETLLNPAVTPQAMLVRYYQLNFRASTRSLLESSSDDENDRVERHPTILTRSRPLKGRAVAWIVTSRIWIQW